MSACRCGGNPSIDGKKCADRRRKPFSFPSSVARQRRRREEREARKQLAEEHAKREAEQAKADAPKITLVVKELTGKAIEVSSLSSLHTVAELKETVAAATGGEAARLRLVFKNVPLEDESTLGSCGVGEGSEVNAVAKAAAQEEELLPQAAP